MKKSSIKAYIFVNTGANMGSKMVISRATSRFPKSELDTMLVSTLLRASLTQKSSKSIYLFIVLGGGEVPQGMPFH